MCVYIFACIHVYAPRKAKERLQSHSKIGLHNITIFLNSMTIAALGFDRLWVFSRELAESN